MAPLASRHVHALLGTVLLLAVAAPLRAQVMGTSIVVNSAADTVIDDGLCTLREAITAANTDSASGSTTGECDPTGGTDTITFAADYTITLGSQLPNITSSIIIRGNGASNTIVQPTAAANTAIYLLFHAKNLQEI